MLVLIALTMAPAAPVAALRETSVVLLMMLAVTGRERVTVARVLGAVLVTLGVACVGGRLMGVERGSWTIAHSAAAAAPSPTLPWAR